MFSRIFRSKPKATQTAPKINVSVSDKFRENCEKDIRKIFSERGETLTPDQISHIVNNVVNEAQSYIKSDEFKEHCDRAVRNYVKENNPYQFILDDIKRLKDECAPFDENYTTFNKLHDAMMREDGLYRLAVEKFFPMIKTEEFIPDDTMRAEARRIKLNELTALANAFKNLNQHDLPTIAPLKAKLETIRSTMKKHKPSPHQKNSLILIAWNEVESAYASLSKDINTFETLFMRCADLQHLAEESLRVSFDILKYINNRLNETPTAAAVSTKFFSVPNSTTNSSQNPTYKKQESRAAATL